MQTPSTAFQIGPGIGCLKNSVLAVMPVEPDRLYGVTRSKYNAHPYRLLYSHGSPQITVDAHHFTDDGDVAGAFRNDDCGHARILRLQANMIFLTIEALQCCFSLHHGNHDVLVVGNGLG